MNWSSGLEATGASPDQGAKRRAVPEQDQLRLMAWNVNHRARSRRIPEGLAPAILGKEPDLVVLTEYVEGGDHEAFTERLADGGLIYQVITPRAKGHNQVFIAARQRISRLDFPVPAALGHASSNLLMVEMPELKLQVMGLRVPFYLKARDARSFWDWFEETVEPLKNRPVVILGDFNADPDKPRGRGSSHLTRLVKRGLATAAAGRGVELPVDHREDLPGGSRASGTRSGLRQGRVHNSGFDCVRTGSAHAVGSCRTACRTATVIPEEGNTDPPEQIRSLADASS